jgi:hypothetical protein
LSSSFFVIIRQNRIGGMTSTPVKEEPAVAMSKLERLKDIQ